MGYFITVEGGEGVGKSTLVTALTDQLNKLGRHAVATREPGGTELGRKIRELILADSSPDCAPLSELLLFAADRAQHCEELIRPALAKGSFVVCDRFVHSTVVYQGLAGRIPVSIIEQINKIATNNLNPDLVVLLDLPPETGLSRIDKRAKEGGQKTKFDAREIDFHRKVRESFINLAKQNPDSFLVVDGSVPTSEVVSMVLDHVNRLVAS